MAYATIAECKEVGFLNIPNTTYNTSLGLVLNAAQKAIDRACHMPDGFVALSTATARYWSGSGGPVQRIDECIEITEVAVKEAPDDTSYVAWVKDTDYTYGCGDPERSPNFNETPYEWIMTLPQGDYTTFINGLYRYDRDDDLVPGTSKRAVPTIKVTAKWGHATTVPDDIKLATIMQTIKWFKRMQGAMTDALAPTNFGTLLYTQPIDPDIKRILIDGGWVKVSKGGIA